MTTDQFDAIVASFDEYVKATDELIALLRQQVEAYKEAILLCEQEMKAKEDLLRREYVRLVVSNPLGRREH